MVCQSRLPYSSLGVLSTFYPQTAILSAVIAKIKPRSNGSGQTNLTNNAADDRYPHWTAFSYWLHLPIVLKQ
jgi:hypothetical protein